MAPLQVVEPKIEEAFESNETEIQQFYNGKTVFLTGATGFFGKITVEKLLRATNIEHIYLLVRIKKGKDVYTRIDEIFNDPIFGEVKRLNPKFRHKVSVISGDCSLLGLGISNEELTLLKQNVNIIIHGAATVRFDETLKKAIAINVIGTREIISIAREMKKLEVMVHISTAFANCQHSHIEEKFYDMDLSAEHVCHLGEILDEDTLDKLTPKLLQDRPNTYTYTKALAEDIIKSHGKDLKIVIFRPGIVLTTVKEPIPGWIDNMYGPCGVIVGAATGILRVFYAKTSTTAQIVPVDLAINALLASAWDVVKNKSDKVPIYNFIPDPNNHITWKDYIDAGYNFSSYLPIKSSMWYPTLSVTSNYGMFTFLSFFYHILPALFIDMGLLLIGKKPRMLQIYKKIHKFCNVMAYFSNNNWTFSNDSVKNLWITLSPEDKKIFHFEMESLDWMQLFEASFYGVRKYIFKEDENTIKDGQRVYRKLKLIHYAAVYLLYALCIFILYSIYSRIYLA